MILLGFVDGQPLPPSLIKLWFDGGKLIDDECRNNFGKEVEEIFEKKAPNQTEKLLRVGLIDSLENRRRTC